MTESDSGRPAVIPVHDNHHANADLAQWKCFENSGLEERRFHKGHGEYYESCSQSPTDDPPLCTSGDRDDAQGTSPTVASTYGQAWSARLSSAADVVPMESPDLPGDSQILAKQMSLPDESPDDIESQSPQTQQGCIVTRTEHLLRIECVQMLVTHLHFMCLLKMRLCCNLRIVAHKHAIRRLADRHDSQTVSHAPVLEHEDESVQVAGRRLDCTLSALRMTIPARDSVLPLTGFSLVKLTVRQIMSYRF